MDDDRDLIECRAFQRWQVVVAFTGGSRRATEALLRRPNRALAAGLAPALATCLAVAIRAMLGEGPAPP